MENIYDNVMSMKKYKLAPEQMLLENNITIEVGEISRVLACYADVDIDHNIEAMNGEANVSGRVVLNVVYVADGGEINNQNCVSPFTYKIKNEYIEPGCKFNLFANVIGTEIEKMNGNQLKVITTINFDGVVIKNVETKYLKDGGSGTYALKAEQGVTSHNRQICDKFEETLEAKVKGGVKKVLMTNVEFAVRECIPGLNFVSVGGELYARVLYVDSGEMPEIQTITITKSIKQEIEVEGINKECDIDLFSHIIKDGVNVELAENGEETTILIKAPIMVCVNTYTNANILLIQDLYSTKDLIEVQNSKTENYENCGMEYIDSKIEGNVVLSDDNPRIDKYLCATNVKANNSNYYVKDGTLTIEGVASANVIYLNDELGEILSVEVEMPYVLDKKIDMDDNAILEPVVCLSDIDVMVKRGREVFFDARAKAYINVAKQTELQFVANADSVGELEPKDSAIEIYFAKSGERIWDIAKGLKVSSEMICNQNPEITDPLEKDQNIAIYYQKERK